MYSKLEAQQVLADLADAFGDQAADELYDALDSLGPAAVDNLMLKLRTMINAKRPRQSRIYDALGLDRLAMERHREASEHSERENERARGRITATTTVIP
ncbi:MAG: hypothetical protein HY914_14505 [Desulfomonile tiedjei]|nr:hypothetical protein [Desulfomonile tiedjei]